MRGTTWRIDAQWAVSALALVVALVVALSVALAGCASQAAPSASPSPTPTNDIATVGSPSPSPTATFVVIPGTPGADAPACRTVQLTLKVSIDFSSARQMGTLTNASMVTCSLFGFPDLQLLNANHIPLSTTVSQSTSPEVWSGVFPEQHIQLAPGASAYFAVAWSATPADAQTTCLAASYLAVSMPNEGGDTVGADPIAACGGDLTVSPFQNAPFMGG